MPAWGWELYPYVHVLGRLLFAMAFIASGLNRLMKLDEMAGYAQRRGVPAPKAATVISSIVILVAGILVLLGWHRLYAAGLLVIYLIPTAFLMHPFWKEQDPAARANETAHFMKDLALAGAALFFAYYAYQEWPLSLGG
jgi:putative oxidoreductase